MRLFILIACMRLHYIHVATQPPADTGFRRWVCVFVCVRACVRARACACACGCVEVCPAKRGTPSHIEAKRLSTAV